MEAALVRSLPLLALLAAAAPLAGCLSEEDFLLPEERFVEPPLETSFTREDRRTGKVVEYSERKRVAGGRTVKHGVERRWYADGTLRAERHFDEGLPAGTWRSWWEDGTLRSEYTHDPLGEPTEMSFWHPNGRLSAQGPARRGTREGLWTYWYEDGTVREQGTYVLGVKDGEWTYLWEDGSLRSRGRYANGERIGRWEHGPRPIGAREPLEAREDDP